MTAGWRHAASFAAVMLLTAACTATTNVASNSPAATPSEQSSPSASPSGGASPTVAASPSSSSTPSGSGVAITSLPFHNGEVGIGYLAVDLGASGGAGGYTWSISGGQFPPGLGLSSDGVVTGTNTSAGHFSFTVKVVDSAGSVATSPAGFQVFSPLTASQPCATQCAVEEGCTVCGVFGVVSGGGGPIRYSITSDNRPSGMGVNGLSLTGAFPPSGPLGAFNLTVQVSDDFTTKTVYANWYVFNHITVTQTSFQCGNSASSCTLLVPYTGGTPGGSPTVKVVGISDAFFFGRDLGAPHISSGANCTTSVPKGLPPGTTSSVGGGVVTLNIPSPGSQGYCSFTARVAIELVDQSPCGPGNCASNVATIDVEI